MAQGTRRRQQRPCLHFLHILKLEGPPQLWCRDANFWSKYAGLYFNVALLRRPQSASVTALRGNSTVNMASAPASLDLETLVYLHLFEQLDLERSQPC
jgi:hypothetical protein